MSGIGKWDGDVTTPPQPALKDEGKAKVQDEGKAKVQEDFVHCSGVKHWRRVFGKFVGTGFQF